MMQKIGQKTRSLRKGLVTALGLGVMAGGLGGCSTKSGRYRTGAFVADFFGADPVAGALYSASSHESRKEAAREGVDYEHERHGEEENIRETSIDQYDNGLRGVGSWISPPRSFVCEGYQDQNGDTYIGRDELINLGSFFECKDPNKELKIKIGSIFNDIRGKNTTVKITNIKTGEIFVFDGCPSKKNDQNIWYDFYIIKEENDKDIHPYRVEWYVDSQLMPKRTIEFFVDYGEKVENSEKISEERPNYEKKQGEDNTELIGKLRKTAI